MRVCLHGKTLFFYLQEDLPELLVFIYSFVTWKDGGAGHADDVVDVDDLGGDVTEGGETDQDFFPCGWWAEEEVISLVNSIPVCYL